MNTGFSTLLRVNNTTDFRFTSINVMSITPLGNKLFFIETDVLSYNPRFHGKRPLFGTINGISKFLLLKDRSFLPSFSYKILRMLCLITLKLIKCTYLA